MKRFLFLNVAAVLLLSGTASADLMVQEYKTGEKVTLDTVTGHYWYWNLADFTNMNYSEQTTAIAGLGTYGYIAGGWHMATGDEIQALIDPYDPMTIGNSFGPSWVGEEEVFYYVAVGESPDPVDFFAWGAVFEFGVWSWSSLVIHDPYEDVKIGAWVTTDSPIVPVPPAVILAVTGLLSSTLGLNRLRRKQ